jgi:hypothetical protein
MLFRSLYCESDKKKIEIIFYNVKYVSVPCVFEELNLKEISKKEALDFFDIHEKFLWDDSRFFRFIGNDWMGFIVAGNIDWIEDKSSYHEDSKLLTLPYAGGRASEYRLMAGFSRLYFYIRNWRAVRP